MQCILIATIFCIIQLYANIEIAICLVKFLIICEKINENINFAKSNKTGSIVSFLLQKSFEKSFMKTKHADNSVLVKEVR